MADAEQRGGAARTVNTQREIQREQDSRDAAREQNKRKTSKSGAEQAGARLQPRDLPAQHLQKSGSEAELDLAPRYLAPVLPVTGSVGAI